jgi:hypothetical protein
VEIFVSFVSFVFSAFLMTNEGAAMEANHSFGVGRAVIVCVLGVLALALVTVRGDAQAKIDVTGTWIFDVTTSAGSGTPTLTFKQDGENLTGTYEGQLGKAPLKGTLKGSAINFSFTGDAQGQTFTVTYSGTATNDSMKGTVDLGGQASGTFTAKRQ